MRFTELPYLRSRPFVSLASAASGSPHPVGGGAGPAREEPDPGSILPASPATRVLSLICSALRASLEESGVEDNVR